MDNITEALKPETFSVLDVAKNRGYPTDTVTVYLADAAAYELHKLEQKIADLDQIPEELETRAAELAAEVKASALTVALRGVAPGLIDALMKKGRALYPDDTPGFSEERARWFEYTLYAEHIESVTDAEGRVDDHTWTADEAETFMGLLHNDEATKIKIAVNDLSFASAYFDQAVSADFS